MGRDCYSIQVNVTIDNHGDERRPRDLALFEELRQRVEKLCSEERYSDIEPRIL